MSSERLNTPISASELERRWALVRAAMKEHRIDVLFMQNNNDFMGGYVKYFTDIPATNGYATAVVFPKDDDMVVISHGPYGTDRKLMPSPDAVPRGTRRVLAEPYFSSAPYTTAYEVELAGKALENFSSASIGLVGTSTLSYAVVDGLRGGRLSNSSFTNFTETVDGIKAIKSPEELRLIRQTARMQDGAIEAAFAAIKPGMKEIEVAAIAQHYCVSRGSEQGIYLTCSYGPGQPVRQAGRYYQNRALRDGDMFTLLVETNGAGGFYTEIGRSCFIGKAPADIKDEHAFVVAARNYTLERLRPGASCKDVFDAYNVFLRANGRPIEARVHCHGQGYDMVERPLVRDDEPMPLSEGMNIACHPNYVTGRVFATFCDNYIIHKSGVERIHTYPEALTRCDSALVRSLAAPMLNVVVLLSSPPDVQRAYRDGIAAIDAGLAVGVINNVDHIDPLLPTMDVLMTYGTFLRGRSDDVFSRSPRLRWVQALGSGTDGLIPASRSGIVVTSIRGIHDAAVSEAAFAMMLALSRDLPRTIRNQAQQVWDRQPSRLLDGKTVGILGVGLIGAALAPRCKAFGMKVVGITARTGRIDHFDELRPRADLAAAVGDVDFLVVLAPLTAENRHLVNAAALSAMKPTSYLVNVARGGVIDEAALIETLRDGRIAGAALDVFATEPLPQGHPFWSLPNVIVTPHTAGMNVDYVTRALPFIRKNVAAFKVGDLAGMTGLVEQPELPAEKRLATSQPAATTSV